MRLLLVEDNYELAKALEKAFEAEGFIIDAVASGEAALFLASEADYDAVVLDLGLPDRDGLSVLAALRAAYAALAVIILTARDSIEDRVQGLDAGADDYLTKPFDTPELLARIRALVRRSSGRTVNTVEVADVVLDINAHTVTCRGEHLELSAKEYHVLESLMRNQGRLLTRHQLETALYPWGGEISSNAVEVYIHGLRKKLGKSFIKTIRGIGYGVGLA
jgi:DNA-binding response OmpR family regulator